MESAWLSSKIAGPSPLPLIHHSATAITGRKIVILGGPSLGQKLRILNAAGLRAWTDAKATGVGPVHRTLHRSMAVPLSSTDEYVFLFGGCTDDESKYFNDAFTLNTRTMTWACIRLQGAVPMPRCGHSQSLSNTNGVTLGWIFGGKYLTKVMNELICVHFTKGQISMTKLDKFNILCDDSSVNEIPARSLHSASVIQRENSATLYIIGGRGAKEEVFNDVWEIDLPFTEPPTATSTVTCRRINFKGNFSPRYDHACEVLDGGKIVLYGGVGADGAVLDDLLMFDTTDYTWYKSNNVNASAPGPRHGHAMTTMNKQVYLMGGDNSSSEVHVLQLDKVTWEPLSGTATMTKPRASSRARVTPPIIPAEKKPEPPKSTLTNLPVAPSNTNVMPASATVSSTHASTTSGTSSSPNEKDVKDGKTYTVPVKTFVPTPPTAAANNNYNDTGSDTSDSPAMARVPQPGSFKSSYTQAPSASPFSKYTLPANLTQFPTPPSSPSVPAAVATSGTSATASSPKVTARRSVTQRGSPTTVTNATAGSSLVNSPKVPHANPSPNAAKVGSPRASISGARSSFGGMKSSSPSSSGKSSANTSSSNIVLVTSSNTNSSSNNNNSSSTDDSTKIKAQNDQLKHENEQLRQSLEKETENAKKLRAKSDQSASNQLNEISSLTAELAVSRQEINSLRERIKLMQQELDSSKLNTSSNDSTNTELELITLNAQLNTLMFENTSLKAQLRLFNSSALQSGSNNNNNSEVKALENELKAAKSNLSQKDEEISQLKRALAEANNKNNEKQAQFDAIKANNEALDAQLVQQIKAKKELESELAHFVQQNNSQKNNTNNTEVERLQAENNQLTNQMISLQNDYQELEITYNKLQVSQLNLQSDLDHIRLQQHQDLLSTQSDSNLALLEQELQQKQVEVQQLTDEVQQWSQAAAQLQIVNEEMVRELQQEIQDLKKELLELSEAYQQERDRRVKAEEELIAAEVKMTEIEGIFSKFVGGSSLNQQ